MKVILKILKIATWVGDATNCYIVFDQESKETMVIDPAGDVDKIIKMIHILQGNLKYIFLTHCHGDHIAGVSELKEKMGGKVLIHREDCDGLNDIEMFKTGGYTVAMGNAADEIKELADVVTKTNNEAGVAYELNKIFYNC